MTTEPQAGHQDPATVVIGERRRWARVGGTWATGHAFVDGQLLRASGLAERLDSLGEEELGRFLASCNGYFAAVVAGDGTITAVVDHVRSIPLFVARTGNRAVITDDPHVALASSGDSAPPWERVAELLAARYVTGPDTLMEDIDQVEAGTCLRLSRTPGARSSATRWFRFRPTGDGPGGSNLAGQAVETLRASVERTVQVAGDAQLVVPLSGGLDSALMAHLLAHSVPDRDQLLTYTFGRPGEEEVGTARARAKALGLRWEFVPYSHETWRALRRQSNWPAVLRSTSSLSAAPNVIDLPAVEQLRERGVLLDDAWLVPGHTGDFLAGSWIPGRLAHRSRGDRGDVVDAILDRHYRCRSRESLARLVDQPADAVLGALRARVERSLPATAATMDGRELVAAADEWAWKERQAKLIVNAVRSYDEHGLRWSMPWWDRAVVDFWAQAPLQDRLGVQLREQMARVADLGRELSLLDRTAAVAKQYVRAWGLEIPFLRLRTALRRHRAEEIYDEYTLAAFGLVDEQRFREWFTGHETPWTFVAEQVLEALEERG